MNVLIKAAKILDASSPHHNTIQDIYIADGVIQKMGENLSFPDAKQISFKNLHISQGWFDSSVSFGEPGYEERETIAHGLDVASSSGFTRSDCIKLQAAPHCGGFTKSKRKGPGQ